MSNFSRDPETNAIASGLIKGPRPIGLMDDDETDDISPQPQSQNYNKMNTDDIQDLFKSAKQNLQDSKSAGVTKEQLDALHKHEGANMWTALFMNLIGASHGLSSKPYIEPLEKRTEAERQGLILQNQLAQQQAQRAGQEQNFGMGQLKGGQALQQQEYSQAPASNLKLATLGAYMKQAKQPFNPDEYKNMYNVQIDQAINEVQKLAGNQVNADRYKDMLGTRGWTKYTDASGATHAYNQMSGEDKVLNAPTQTDVSKPVSYNDIAAGSSGLPINQQKIATKELPKIASDYQKTFGQPSLQFNQSIDNVEKLIDLSQQGNYKAANSLAAQTAKLFEGLGNQRLTNMQISMENDPIASGYINRLNQLIQGSVGQGKVTPQDAKNMREVAQELRNIHNKTLNEAQQFYNSKAEAVIGRPFKDEKYLFGQSNSMQAAQPESKVSGNDISFDDYMKQRGN